MKQIVNNNSQYAFQYYQIIYKALISIQIYLRYSLDLYCKKDQN